MLDASYLLLRRSLSCGQSVDPGVHVHTILMNKNKNFMVSSVNWVRIPVVVGFVVLWGANIVGNIISVERRFNYPGQSRITRLVLYRIPGLEFDGGTAAICRCALSTGRNAS